MKSILIVDDDQFHRSGLGRFLDLHNWQVSEAPNASAALALSAVGRFDAAILDMRFPQAADQPPHVTAGLDLAQQLLASHPEIALLFLSAYDTTTAALSINSQNIPRLSKGCSPEDILRFLESAFTHDSSTICPAADRSTTEPDMPKSNVDEQVWLHQAGAHMTSLSARESEIARLIAESHSITGIAASLVLSEHYVQNTLSRIYQKLGLTQLPPRFKKDVILAKAYIARWRATPPHAPAVA
jgi:DNA-binding NarL/FixJ family response regulator